MTQTTVALNTEWLNGTTTTFNSNCTNAMVGTTLTITPNYYPGIWWYPYEGPARPIKLGLSEVERLRTAAKRDAKLKKILEKFTELIQIEVDFE